MWDSWLELRLSNVVAQVPFPSEPSHQPPSWFMKRLGIAPYFNTSKLVSAPQLQVQQGPTTRSTVWRSASRMENLGRKGCQVCSTWPMVVPGGACTSIWRGRQTGLDRIPWPELFTGASCLWFRTSLNLPLLLSATHSGPVSILSTSHHKTYATHLLKATGAAAAATVEWADEAEHLTVPRVR